ncbi:MAG: hypothetical protein JWP97_5697 [Labilithrix sp.]|nr:hypothetical protein [Labilithrix sp.]
MVLDVREDFVRFREALARGVEEQARSPALPITRVDFGFGINTGSPRIVGIFDTEPGGEPDSGTSTTYPFLDAAVTTWEPAIDALDASSIALQLPSSTVTITDGDMLIEHIGDAFVELLLEAKATGLLARLPRAAVCYLGVGEFQGNYSWPAWKKRGPANCV